MASTPAFSLLSLPLHHRASLLLCAWRLLAWPLSWAPPLGNLMVTLVVSCVARIVWIVVSLRSNEICVREEWGGSFFWRERYFQSDGRYPVSVLALTVAETPYVVLCQPTLCRSCRSCAEPSTTRATAWLENSISLPYTDTIQYGYRYDVPIARSFFFGTKM